MPRPAALLAPLLLLVVLAGSARAADPPEAGSAAPAALLEVHGVLTPGLAAYLHAGLDQAAREGAQVVVLSLDTPGGTDAAARVALQGLLSSPLPVIGLIPRGARVSSTGVYLLLGCERIYVAPHARLGPSHPIALAGRGASPNLRSRMSPAQSPATVAPSLSESQAFARQIATSRGDLPLGDLVAQLIGGERVQGVEAGVSTLVASDGRGVEALLGDLNGQRIQKNNRTTVLYTGGAELRRIVPAWYVALGQLVAQPWVMLLFLLVGVIGLIAEVLQPGTLIPALVGLVGVAGFGYGLAVLPVDPWGVLWIVTGALAVVVEAKVAGPGLFGIPGIVAFTYGVWRFIPAQYGDLRIGEGSLLAMGLGFLAAAFLGIRYLRSQLAARPSMGGIEALIGKEAEVRRRLAPTGMIYLHGELWQARTAEGTVLDRGAKVRVLAKEGPVLIVTSEPPATTPPPAGES